MFVKRARPRPSTRTREVDAEDPPSAAASPQAVETGEEVGSVMERKKAQRKKLGKSKLSFGGEEEASESTPFKQRKSLLSQALQANAAATPSSPAASGTPSYSRDYLEELKASTPSRAPRAEDAGESSSGLSQAAREKYGDMLVEDESAGIPDAAAIAAAKNRRAQASRGTAGGEEEDYISLGGSKGPHPESRLMREEDEMDDGDEDLADYTGANDRLFLGKEANRAAARRMRNEMGEMIAEREDESESDEEMREWEDTIVARAGHGIVAAKKEKPKAIGYTPTPIPPARPVPTLAATEARIAQKLAQLRVSKDESETTLENATKDLVLLEEQERDLRKQVEEVEGKREWVEEFSGWAELLGTFLEEKYPKLEDIEKDSDQFMRERGEIVSTRRMADDGDDLSLFLGIPRAAEGAEKSAIDTSSANSDYRSVRRIARADRRGRLKGVVNSAATAAEEGFSTDSDLDAEAEDDYTASQHDLERRVHALMEDVKAEDFRYPERGLAVRFADWRKRYAEDYEGAFGGLALVQAWEFWARGEMVGWDPLRSDKQLETFTWFTALYNYSRPQSDRDDDDMDIDELGPDGDLASEMVSKAVVPLLIRVLGAGAYDPYSAPQTRRAVDLVDVVAELTGKDSKKYQSLVKAVMGVFQSHIFALASAVASSGGPSATPPPPFNPAARSAMQRYTRRRLKLIRNLLLWRRTAPTEVTDLVARVGSVVLRPVLTRTWEGGGADMAQKVLEVAGQSLPPNLVSFLRNGK